MGSWLYSKYNTHYHHHHNRVFIYYTTHFTFVSGLVDIQVNMQHLYEVSQCR